MRRDSDTEKWNFLHFNVRSLTRSDERGQDLYSGQYPISIHAPSPGATSQCTWSDCTAQFQSTLPHRERLVIVFVIRRAMVFQSTLPHRERPMNPFSVTPACFISIHAPSPGATSRYRNSPPGVRFYFNPRSLTGSDRSAAPRPGRSQYFNPRSLTGSDWSSCNQQ